MKLSIDDQTIKEILTVIEEISLANAIKEGRQDDFVSEETILALLDGKD
jgi:hypothetical protein